MNDLANPAQDPSQLALEAEPVSMAVQLAQVEINTHVATAKQYPRSFQRAMNNIHSLVSLDEQTAEECIYALPRGGKAIKGPSVRFAEIVASQWGNCHTGSRVVAVDKIDKVVIAEGVFHDLETGMKRIAQVRRRISDKNGRLFNDDMIVVTGNAACSIAMREAILKGVPKAVWRKAYETAENVLAGDVKTLVERRDMVIKVFAALGVNPEMIAHYLEVESIDDVTIDHIATLQAVRTQIKSGENKPDDFFDMSIKAVTGKAAPKKPAAPKPPAEPKKPDVPTDAQKAKALAEAEAKAKADAEKAAAEAAAEAEKKAAAETAKKAEAKEPEPDQAELPVEEQQQGPSEDVLKKHKAAYDLILADALEVGAEKVEAEHAKRLDAMSKEAPDLFKSLMEELDEHRSVDEDEDGDDGDSDGG